MVTPLGFVKDLVSTSQNSSVTMVNPNGELLNGLLTHSIIYLVTVLPLQMFIVKNNDNNPLLLFL